MPYSSRINTRRSGLSFAKRTYLPRAFGLGIGMFCVGSVLYTQNAPLWLWLMLVLNGLVWPHIAYLLASRSEQPFEQEIINMKIDSALGGVWVAIMSFNALPSVVILSMMSMNNIASGGKNVFVKGWLYR